MPYAPAFHMSAANSGSGKSFLCELVGAFAGPAGNVKTSYPVTAEEATSKAPHLIYLPFEPSPLTSAASEGDYVADLSTLYALMGKPMNFPFYLVTIPAKPTSAFGEIAGDSRREPRRPI